MNGTQGTSTLIIYGDLPAFRGTGPGGMPGPLVFDGKLTHHNRQSFERLLVRELGGLMERSLHGATVKQVKALFELQRLLRGRAFSTVIFYGHTITLTSSGPVAAQQELALAGNNEFLSSRDFANTLKAAGVRETFIAGCSSVSFAAGVFSVTPSIRAGGLYFDRTDDAKGNANSVIDLRIQKQPIKWWAVPGSR